MTKEEMLNLLNSENKGVGHKVYVFEYPVVVETVIECISEIGNNDIFLPDPCIMEDYENVFFTQNECWAGAVRQVRKYCTENNNSENSIAYLSKIKELAFPYLYGVLRPEFTGTPKTDSVRELAEKKRIKVY